MQLTARNDILIVQRTSSTKTTASGLVIAGGNDYNPYATVVALGPQRKDLTDALIAWDFALGDQVLTSGNPQAVVEDANGGKLELYRSNQVLAFIENTDPSAA